jgi:probable F420-dependent oxidoreductase
VRYGLSAYDLSGSDLVALAVAAEEAGFDSLWLGEHLLLADGYATAHPTHVGAPGPQPRAVVDAGTRLLDPLVALAAAAAVTSRITLGTAIYLLPLRHPLAVARATLTLHELSGGRFRFGAGLGWLREEFAALGVPFAERRARLEESVAILRRAWAGGIFEHHGDVYDFGPVQLTAEPVPVPLVLGGNSPEALRRAARWADGWFASASPSRTEAAALLANLAAACAETGRREPIETWVRVAPDTTDLTSYEDEGVDSVIFWAHELCPAGPDRWRGLAAASARLGIGAGAGAGAR